MAHKASASEPSKSLPKRTSSGQNPNWPTRPPHERRRITLGQPPQATSIQGQRRLPSYAHLVNRPSVKYQSHHSCHRSIFIGSMIELSRSSVWPVCWGTGMNTTHRYTTNGINKGRGQSLAHAGTARNYQLGASLLFLHPLPSFARCISQHCETCYAFHSPSSSLKLPE